ncbi:hypothetical protein BH09ACT7_BH09ACT7_23860 [soil metagenome]
MSKSANFIDGYLNSPLSGIAPWVLFSVLSSPGRFEVAVCSALGLSVLTLWISSRRGIGVYALDTLGVAFFAVLAVVGLVASEGTIAFLELWAGELTNVVLALFVIATIVIRKPFTIAYAKKQAPEEYWDTPLFRKINYMISGVWAAAFTFSAVVGLIGDGVLHDPNNFWTGWVLQLAALFFAIAFTEFYPDYAGAKDAVKRGEHEPVPPVLRLFDWLPTFVLIAGIFGWVTDALPDVVGIGMIVIGVAGGALVRKFVPTAEESHS